MTRAFVFVVCGPRDHIETLNTSLPYLRRFSRHEILVVTDLARNQATIQHDRILDVSTPATLTHHQASIYLKTGLPRWLPPGQVYCYVDSDILAVDHRVNDVFDQDRGIVAFAPDHCPLANFSPHATRCGSLERHERRRAEFERHMGEANSKRADLMESLREWRDHEQQLKQPPLRRRMVTLRWLIRQWRNMNRRDSSSRILRLTQFAKHFSLRGFRYDRSKQEWCDLYGNRLICNFSRFFHERGFEFDLASRTWYDLCGNYVMGDTLSGQSARLGGIFHHDPVRQCWLDENDESVLEPARCSHLVNKIEDEFRVRVNDGSWRHWNGGLFVFDDRSRAFLDYWHEASRRIFQRPDWRVRDQGTLVAATWKFGLQDAPTLPVEFNFIADYNSTHLALDKERGFRVRDGGYVRPYFVHVYHEFGRRDWDVWRWLESILLSNQASLSNRATLAATE